MSTTRIAFIGAGNMAASIIGGLLRQGRSPTELCAANPGAQRRQQVADDYGIAVFAGNREAIAGAQVVVLAVKPQIMQSVCQNLATHLDPRQLVVSVAAGITTASLRGWLNTRQPVVRCMPNTPAQLGAGASVLFAANGVDGEQKALAEELLAAVGTTLWLPEESLLDAATAVSGSGPAYFFLLMEAMASAGERLGLSREAALALTTQTALGAARMAKESGLTPDELRRRVTSPKGTTEAAIQRLQDGAFETLVEQALEAAARRSAQLSLTYR